MQYLCSVKILRSIIILLVCWLPSASWAEQSWADSVDISLITCGPGNEIWSQYGHTALRVNSKATGQDIAINYGMFSSDQPWFALRFIFGLTDYHVESLPFSLFLEEYREEGRSVVEQKLSLSAADKARILAALDENLRPENKMYRYNFFYDNCSTRPRDIIARNLSAPLTYNSHLNRHKSFRKIIHEWNNDAPWAQFGEDLLLGIEADQSTTRSEQQFLPAQLQLDFDSATVAGKPIVESEAELLPQTLTPSTDFEITPRMVMAALLVLALAIGAVELRRKRVCYWWDVVLMAATTVPGVILTLMIFSQHPCVRINLLLLLLNPLPLFFGWHVIMKSRRDGARKWWTAQASLVVLGIVAGFFQTFPAGTACLALSLLTRPTVHLMLKK